MRYSPFWNKRRGAVDVASIFPPVNVSQVEALSLMKLSDTHVAAVEALSLLKLSDTHVAGLEVLTLLKTATLINPLVDRNITNTGPRAATVRYDVVDTGYIFATGSNGVYTQFEQWLNTGAVGDYEVRFTSITGLGDLTITATLGVWLDLASTQSVVGLVSGRNKYGEFLFTVEIRDKATSTVQESATIYMSAFTDGGVEP